MAKKVPYKKLLTEAISEFDTSKTAQVKGPFLDPILSWDGGGELPTNKPIDAGQILERYYYREQNDAGVDVYENDDTEATSYENPSVKGKTTDHTMGAGTEQAGTNKGHNTADDREELIAKEDYDLTEDLENSIIEKIIAEMEEEDDEDEEKMSEMEDKFEGVSSNAKKVGGDSFEGVKSSLEAPDEKEMKDPEQHSMGAGTPQAGTGDKEGEVPDRRDMHDKMVKPHNYVEALLFEEDDEDMDDDDEMDEEMREALSLLEAEDEDEDMDDKEEMEERWMMEQEEEGDEDEEEEMEERWMMEQEEEGDEEEELDVDEKMSEADSAVPGGPTPHQYKAKHGGDDNAYDEVEEAFKIFKEQMEDEDEEDEEEDED